MKETSNNDVAAERSETAVAPASGTWEPLVPQQCSLHQEENKRLLSSSWTQCHALDILNCGPLRVVPSVEEHERLLEQVCAYMDAVRPDMVSIMNAFGLSVKFVDIEWPNTSRGISVGVVHQGHTTKERHSEVKRALVGFLEDHEMNKFTGPISFHPYQDNQRHV